MHPTTWLEFERRCQKPDHRLIGNWMARRITRPLALRVTWVIAPLGISANWATLLAWACAIAAAPAFGWGSVFGWLVGAACLQLWYLLDHVDGQLARFHGAASLDGVQLDYLMHHTVTLLIPFGVGWGLFARSAEPAWLLAGLGWGTGALLLGLQNDSRYKAFVQRLKRVRGALRVVGGGAGRPSAATPAPRQAKSFAIWLGRKSCEPHVVMNVLTMLAAGQWLLADNRLLVGGLYAAAMTTVSIVLAVATIVRSQAQHAAETEFARWYRPPQGHVLSFEDGWWIVQPLQSPQAAAEEAEGVRLKA